MNWFDILIGISSIGSFIVAVVALFKVDSIKKHIIKNESNNTSQTIKKTKITDSNVMQVGRDSRGD